MLLSREEIQEDRKAGIKSSGCPAINSFPAFLISIVGTKPLFQGAMRLGESSLPLQVCMIRR
jgi:hypothetical protein